MSSCTCIYTGASDNWPVAFWPTEPIARKEHKCHECKCTIRPGEKYHNDSGKWEDRFYSFKVCVPCREITDAFFCEGFTYGGVFEALYEHIQDHEGKISEWCLADLSPAARAKVCDTIEEYWKNEPKWWEEMEVKL